MQPKPLSMQWLFSNALWLLAVIIVTILVLLGLVKLLFRNMESEKLTMYLDFTKWIVVSVALVIIATVIDSSLKDRQAGINEIKQYDTYVNLVIQADGIGQRWRLAQYFSKVTASKNLRDRWIDYFQIVETEYLDSLKKQVALLAEAKRLDSLSKLPGSQGDTALKKQIEINDQQMRNLGKELSTSTWSSVKPDDGAAKFERQGFGFLLQRDVEGAITAFNNAEQNITGYHMVYDIWNYLRDRENRSALSDSKNDAAWKKAYTDILRNFSWKMPADIKDKMNELSRN